MLSSQQTIRGFMNSLEAKIWEGVADKNLQRIARPATKDDTVRTFQDFVFMNSQLGNQSGTYINKTLESKGALYEKNMLIQAKIVPRETQSKNSSIVSKPTSILHSKRKPKRLPTKVKTQPVQSHKDSQIMNTTSLPLYMSSEPQRKDSREERFQEMMRIAKNEKQKYDVQEIKREEERKLSSALRMEMQRKKFKQVKLFTYDYAGKIMAMGGQRSNQMKINNLKSFFKPSILHNRQSLSKRSSISMIEPSQMTNVSIKKVIEHKKQEDEDSLSVLNMGKTTPIKLIQMFKGQEEYLQMGVSVTDVLENSTIYGHRHKPIGNESMKLSQFKENKSSFKPRHKTLETTKTNSRATVTRKNLPPVVKEKSRCHSNAQSRILSSSFSHIEKKRGKITRNQPVFSQNFAQL